MCGFSKRWWQHTQRAFATYGEHLVELSVEITGFVGSIGSLASKGDLALALLLLVISIFGFLLTVSKVASQALERFQILKVVEQGEESETAKNWREHHVPLIKFGMHLCLTLSCIATFIIPALVPQKNEDNYFNKETSGTLQTIQTGSGAYLTCLIVGMPLIGLVTILKEKCRVCARRNIDQPDQDLA